MKHVDRYVAPVQQWRTDDPLHLIKFTDGDVGMMLHRCYDPMNPYADHDECGQTVMNRWFALRKALLLGAFALGLTRRNRHTFDIGGE